MPRYDFRCPTCGQVYEVSRPMSRAIDPLLCLVDKTACERVISAPMINGRADASAPPQGSSGWSHAGHSHDAGAGSHGHDAAP